MNEIKLTDGRKALIQALMTGACSWTQLRLAYYGPIRVESKASTSFYNQLVKLITLNVITKENDKYVLGEVGKKLVEEHKAKLEGEFKSVAQQKAEALEKLVKDTDQYLDANK